MIDVGGPAAVVPADGTDDVWVELEVVASDRLEGEEEDVAAAEVLDVVDELVEDVDDAEDDEEDELELEEDELELEELEVSDDGETDGEEGP